MKGIVVYHSQTGSTKQIAEAIHTGMSQVTKACYIARIREIDPQELRDYDLVGLGSPVIDFKEPGIMTSFMENMPLMEGKYGFTFCTHGIYPGAYITRMVSGLRGKGATVTGWNDWYGGVLLPFLRRPYYTDGHPDEIDLREARDFGKEIVECSQRISMGETDLIPELPEKEEYNKIYGIIPVPALEGTEAEKAKKAFDNLRPRFNADKCTHPKCSLCMKHCPTRSIDLSKTSPINTETCEACFFCEQICPTGGISIDWNITENMEEMTSAVFASFAEPLKRYQKLRRFRNLVPFDKIFQDDPLHKTHAKRPRLVIRDGVGVLREKDKKS